MKRLFLLSAFVLTGCLGSAPKRPVCWTIETEPLAAVGRVVVSAPYSGTRFAVLRADGSLAFDAYNVFAASPSAILSDALVSRRKNGVLTVRKLALDCRKPDQREAVVELEILRWGVTVKGAASAPTADGNYTAAFSAAFSAAYRQAVQALPAK